MCNSIAALVVGVGTTRDTTRGTRGITCSSGQRRRNSSHPTKKPRVRMVRRRHAREERTTTSRCGAELGDRFGSRVDVIGNPFPQIVQTANELRGGEDAARHRRRRRRLLSMAFFPLPMWAMWGRPERRKTARCVIVIVERRPRRPEAVRHVGVTHPTTTVALCVFLAYRVAIIPGYLSCARDLQRKTSHCCIFVGQIGIVTESTGACWGELIGRSSARQVKIQNEFFLRFVIIQT